jgi:hypothetical protein
LNKEGRIIRVVFLHSLRGELLSTGRERGILILEC